MNADNLDRFEQLHHDHLHLNRLVEDLRASLQACLRDEGDAEELFGTVEEFVAAASDELYEHFDAEESGLFPYVLERLPETKAMIRSLESGHDRICGTLARLERFVANFSKHAIEEEAMLNSLSERLDPAARKELARLLAEI
jgi:hemerythrin-like domain-containing protein